MTQQESAAGLESAAHLLMAAAGLKGTVSPSTVDLLIGLAIKVAGDVKEARVQSAIQAEWENMKTQSSGQFGIQGMKVQDTRKY